MGFNRGELVPVHFCTDYYQDYTHQGRRYRVHEYTIVYPWPPETCILVYRNTGFGHLHTWMPEA